MCDRGNAQPAWPASALFKRTVVFCIFYRTSAYLPPVRLLHLVDSHFSTLAPRRRPATASTPANGTSTNGTSNTRVDSTAALQRVPASLCICVAACVRPCMTHGAPHVLHIRQCLETCAAPCEAWCNTLTMYLSPCVQHTWVAHVACPPYKCNMHATYVSPSAPMCRISIESTVHDAPGIAWLSCTTPNVDVYLGSRGLCGPNRLGNRFISANRQDHIDGRGI